MLTYRKEIDGLRGLAVLLVLLFHFKMPGLQAGFIGVDIFFVISGYLIGSIIWNELESNNFSFGRFYERRVRRILPALYTLVAVCLLFSFLCVDNLYFKQLSASCISAVLFVSNIFFYRTTRGYFDTANGDLVMLHTWSLSVEEQLYIIFPIVLFLLHKYCRKYVFHFFLLFALVSFMASIVLSHNHGGFSFFLPVTRTWEFLAGFFLVKKNLLQGGRAFKQIISWAGVICIIIGLLIIDKETVFPGYHALFPVLGTVALLFSQGDPLLPVNRFFSFQPLVFAGKISFSLYLWHWPVKLFSEYLLLDPHSVQSTILVLITILLLSYLSWRFIETPFRRKDKVIGTRKELFAGFAGVAVVLSCISFYVFKKNGLPHLSRVNAILNDGSNLKTAKKWQEYTLFIHELPEKKSLPVIGNAGNPGEFLLWGDSQAAAIVPGFEAAALEEGKSGYIAEVLTLPVLGENRYIRYLDANVADVDSSILRFIASHPQIKKVFLCARWRFQEDKLPADTASTPVFRDGLSPREYVTLFEGLHRMITALEKLGKKVVILCPLPQLAAHPRTYLFQWRFFNTDINSITPGIEEYFKRNKEMLDFFEQISRQRGVELIPIHEPLFKNGKLILMEGNHLLYTDYIHLSEWGAVKMKNLIKEKL